MTPAQLRRMAQQGRSRIVKLRATADALEKQCAELDRLADIAESSLHNSAVKSRVKSNMHSDHKLAISAARATRDKKFKDTIRNGKPRFTQAALAAAVGMKESLLSMCRSGERAMFLSRAKRVEELTGWPADKAHWPGGIIEDA